MDLNVTLVEKVSWAVVG